MKKIAAVLLTCLLFTGTLGVFPALAAPQPGPHDLFVSPAGNDAAEGTLSAPLKTLQAAKEKLQSLKGTLPETERVYVWLMPGVYEFSETLCFTEADQPNVTFAAYGNGDVIFSGAREISGFTEETVNGVRAFVKKLGENDPKAFKSLFRDGAQLCVPRYPEEGYFTVKELCPEDDLWTEDDTPWSMTLGQRSFRADPNDLAVEFTNPTDVQVRILHYWHDELMYLTGIDRVTGKLGLSRPSSMRIREIDRYYFENVFEALNEPGEWYLNTDTDTLYYVPEENETAESCVLRGSSLECLMDINGVSGLRFEGIRFTETDWNVPTPGDWWSDNWRSENDIDAPQAAADVKGAVTVRYAENVAFVNCEFVNLGADGVKLINGVRHSRVEGCLFRNIAATAVYVGGSNCLPEEPDAAADITVTNNLIDGYGKKFYCAIGVHLTYCNGAEISHNEITDGYYTAISCGWNWGYSYHLTHNIKITDNLIYNIGQGWLSDMGGIYMLGFQPGTVLSGNVIHNVAANPGDGGYGGWGIYLDEGSSRMLVENNLVFCCASESYNIHYGEGNVFRNNIGAFSAEGQVSPGSRGEETHATAEYYDNIFLTDGAPVYIYMLGTGHFYDNGNLFWDIKKGDDLRFATDSGGTLLTLQQAKAQGFIHNETAADPLFADAKHYDFTLSQDSPALKLNFRPWDYAEAGTVKGSTVGFSLEGGKTAYNDRVSPAVPTGNKTNASFSGSLKTPLAVFGGLLAAVWLAVALLRSRKTPVMMLLSVCVGALSGWFVYRTFVNWSPALYVIGLTALCAAAAALTLVSGRQTEKLLLRFFIRFGVIFAAFFALVLLLNNLLRIGEANAISILLGGMAILAAVCTALGLKKMKHEEKTTDKEEQTT